MGEAGAHRRSRRESVGSVSAAIEIGALLDRGRWTPYQKLLTALAALAVIFDGFDIQILGFAIPSLMKEWGVARAAFGPVLALGLAGMAAGSPFAGYWGDRFGRRPALIGCVALFGLATVATAFVHSVFAAGGAALPHGHGGGRRAAECQLRSRPSSRRCGSAPWRVKLTIVCVPLGGMLGGLIAAQVLPALGGARCTRSAARCRCVRGRAVGDAAGIAPFPGAASANMVRSGAAVGRMGRAVPRAAASKITGREGREIAHPSANCWASGTSATRWACGSLSSFAWARFI